MAELWHLHILPERCHVKRPIFPFGPNHDWAAISHCHVESDKNSIEQRNQSSEICAYSRAQGSGMLSDIEITYFRSRIDDVLRDGRPTAWQRKFLLDMREKIDRYGTRTRLSDKQLSLLRRLTKIDGTPVSQVVELDRYRSSHTPNRRRWKRSARRWRYREIKFLAVLLVLLAVGVGQLVTNSNSPLGLGGATTKSAAPSSFSAQRFEVTDGDTIRLADGTPVRLVGFNTPEKFEPMCAREGELGVKASERLRQLVSSGNSSVTRVACACAPGTEGTNECNFGRSCGILRVNGKDVGQTLIAEGLAVPFQCGRTKCPRLPRPWCS